MKILEQLERRKNQLSTLQAGEQARIKHTGQIVEVKKVSAHGICVVRFRTGCEYFISNRFLEPLVTLH